MSMEAIKEALAERDQVVKSQLEKLGDQTIELRDRVTTLEQIDHSDIDFGGGSPLRKHSLNRVLKALADPRGTVDGFEAEWSQEFEQKSGLKLPGAVWVPLSTKAVDYNSESPTSGGSNLVRTELRSNEFIDILRQQSVIMRLRPTVIRGEGNISVPKASSGSTAYWVSGDGAAITESEGVYSSVTLEPTFCAALVKYNYRVGLQTGGDVENIIRRDLVAQIAAEIDNQGFNGDGTGSKITGILNSGINSHTYTSSPKAVQWSDVVELEKLLIDDKADLTACAYVAGPTCYKLLKTVSRAGTEAVFLADFQNGRATLNGYPLYVSTHVPTNQLVFGDFSELLVGDWGGVALMSDPYTNFNTGTTGVRAMWPTSMAVRHAESFAVAS